jgi:hypothetical protein
MFCTRGCAAGIMFCTRGYSAGIMFCTRGCAAGIIFCTRGCGAGGIMFCTRGCAGVLASYVTVHTLMLTYKNRSIEVAGLYVVTLLSVRYWTDGKDNTDHASFPVLKITQHDQTEHWPGQSNENDDASCPFLRATSRSTS